MASRARSESESEPAPAPEYWQRLGIAEIAASYASADDALAAGAHYIALDKAHATGDRACEGAALILCGWPERGLALMGDDRRYADVRALGAALCGHAAEPLRRVLVLAGPHTANAVPDGPLPGYLVRKLVLAADDRAPPLNALDIGGQPPDLILVLDIFNTRLPPDLSNAACPLVFWAYDCDFRMAGQHDALALADVILVHTTAEHEILRRTHGVRGTRIAAFITHDVIRPANRFRESAPRKDIDILHTGISFHAANRFKARFLWRIASEGGDNLNVRIVHGFLPDAEYRDALARSRLVAAFDRFPGGMLTRAMDAACLNSAILCPEGSTARRLLGQAGVEFDEIGRISSETLDAIVRRRRTRLQPADIAPLREIFPDMLQRRAHRLLEYAFFQARLAGRKPAPRRIVPESLHTNVCRRVQSLLEQNARQPFDVDLTRRADTALADALTRFADSLPLHFMAACYRWMLQDRKRAVALFLRAAELAEHGRFDPRREDIRLNVLRSKDEMLPLEDYCAALVRDHVDGDGAFSGARLILGATVCCYLALDHLQAGRFAAGLAAADSALKLFPDHFAAARLRAKALIALDASPSDVIAAIDRAVDLFPLAVNELLPFALAAERANGNEAGALARAKAWCRFITRVEWRIAHTGEVPPATWNAVEDYLAEMPPALAAAVRTRRSQSAA